MTKTKTKAVATKKPAAKAKAKTAPKKTSKPVAAAKAKPVAAPAKAKTPAAKPAAKITAKTAAKPVAASSCLIGYAAWLANGLHDRHLRSTCCRANTRASEFTSRPACCG